MEINSNKKDNLTLLGFLGLYETQSHSGLIGTILITDLQGLPKEFRCTIPIRPTVIQKSLYGEMLEPYIGVSICGKPLLDSIENKPYLIIINKEFFLDVRKIISYPMVFICRAGEGATNLKTSGSSEIAFAKELIECPTGKFPAYYIYSASSFSNDLILARTILGKIYVHFDPMEPFDRLAKAIQSLGKHDDRFE